MRMSQQKVVQDLREQWHHFLPTALRHFHGYEQVKNGPLHPRLHVYEPSKVQRKVLWITGNAFLFEEPASHHPLLSYLAETTQSQIFALSHRKIPEFTCQDILKDLIDSIDALQISNQLPGLLPWVLAGDSSGALLGTHVLSYLQQKTPVHQIMWIAPIFDMQVFLEEEKPFSADGDPELQRERENQTQLMRFIASLLYKEDRRLKPAIDVLRNSEGKIPPAEIFGLKKDVFYEQAVALQSTFSEVNLHSFKDLFHADYLLRGEREQIVQSTLLPLIQSYLSRTYA